MKKSLFESGRTIYQFVPRLGVLLANLGICAMTILVATIAILRYSFSWTPMWGDEICAFLIIFIVFMGAGHALIEGRHIRITAFFDKLPLRAQNITGAIHGLIALFFIGYLGYSLTQLALMSLRLGSRTINGVPLFPLQILLPVGLLMLFVPLVGFTIRKIGMALRASRGKETT